MSRFIGLGWLALVVAACASRTSPEQDLVHPLERSGPLQGAVDSMLASLDGAGTPFTGHLIVLDSTGVLAETLRGLANVEHRVPLNDSTVYRIASISKQFTGLLAVRLAARGVLDLDAPVRVYLPALEEAPAGRVSLRQLLGHTAGLPPNPDYLWDHVNHGYAWNWRANQPSSTFSADSFLASFAQEEALRPPGVGWEYCNSCYVLAGLVLEKVAHTTFAELLRAEILHPLEMSRTGIEELDALIPNKAYGYERDSTGRLRPHSRFRDLAAIAPAGGMYTTMNDLRRWACALFFSDEFLSRTEREMYFTPGLNRSAFGFTVEETLVLSGDTLRTTFHTGEIAGTHALVMFVADLRTVVLILSNVGFSFPHRRLREALVAAVAAHHASRASGGAEPGRREDRHFPWSRAP